jgi:nitroreductase
MDVFTAIEKRRAVKHFDPKHQMTPDEEKKILSAAILSPTAFNIQNWRLVVVKDADLRKKIRAVSWDQAQVTDSSLFVVLCADLKAWEKNPGRYWANAPQPAKDFLLPAIQQYYSGKDQTQRDEAMRSCGILAMNLMLGAKALGYDSCPMDGFDFAAVGQLLKLPADHVIAMFVAIGKGTKEAWDRPGQLPLSEVVIHNTF